MVLGHGVRSSLQFEGGESSRSQMLHPQQTQQGEPDMFKGEGVEFADWAFVFKSCLACINLQYVGLLERAEQNRTPMPNRALGTADQQN